MVIKKKKSGKQNKSHFKMQHDEKSENLRTSSRKRKVKEIFDPSDVKFMRRDDSYYFDDVPLKKMRICNLCGKTSPRMIECSSCRISFHKVCLLTIIGNDSKFKDSRICNTCLSKNSQEKEVEKETEETDTLELPKDAEVENEDEIIPPEDTTDETPNVDSLNASNDTEDVKSEIVESSDSHQEQEQSPIPSPVPAPNNNSDNTDLLPESDDEDVIIVQVEEDGKINSEIEVMIQSDDDNEKEAIEHSAGNSSYGESNDCLGFNRLSPVTSVSKTINDNSFSNFFQKNVLVEPFTFDPDKIIQEIPTRLRKNIDLAKSPNVLSYDEYEIYLHFRTIFPEIPSIPLALLTNHINGQKILLMTRNYCVMNLELKIGHALLLYDEIMKLKLLFALKQSNYSSLSEKP